MIIDVIRIIRVPAVKSVSQSSSADEKAKNPQYIIFDELTSLIK